MERRRAELGNALVARADDVVAAVFERVWPAGTGALDAAAVEAIAEAERTGMLLIARWLTGGDQIDEHQRRRLAELGEMADRVSLGDLTKTYLAWRDVMLAVLDEEARRLGSPEDLVAFVRTLISRNSDGSLVRMARRFDAERKRLHEALDAERAKLSEQASHDPLTGLPNRTLLFDRLEHALGLSLRTRRPVAILFVDLDGFKSVNDRFGHLAGDELLAKVARRLREAVRRGDTVARLGGDEFVVLCEDLDTARRPIEIAERVIAAVERPVALRAGAAVAISASVGVAQSDGDDTPSELLVRADAAIYAAKQRGPGRHSLAA